MKIGMIVYSEQGHTLSVIEKLYDELAKSGHDPHISRITIQGEPQTNKFEIVNNPATGEYDALVFAAPVQAFSLNPVMKSYLEKLPSLENKPTVYITTKQLIFRWTGGNRAIRTMQQITQAKDAQPLGSSILIWGKNGPSDAEMTEAVNYLTQLFAN